jgi:hypothetical protein
MAGSSKIWHADVELTCASDGRDASDHAADDEGQHHHLEQVEEEVAEQRDEADDLQRTRKGITNGRGAASCSACLLGLNVFITAPAANPNKTPKMV